MSVPNYVLFSMKITRWLILHFLEPSSALSLAAGFFRVFGLFSLSVGFFCRPGRTYLATLQCFSWLLEGQKFLLAFFH